MFTNDIGTKSGTYTIDNSYEKWVLQAGDTLTSSANAITESSNWHDNVFMLNGTITAGTDNSSSVLDGHGYHATVTVGADAHLSGQYGIETYGDRDTIIVNGEITATRSALWCFGENLTIVNNGILIGNSDPGNFAAVNVGSDTKLSFTNNGTITGDIRTDAANLNMTLGNTSVVHGSIDLISDAGDVARLVNQGVVEGEDFSAAVYGWDGKDIIVNHGKLIGGVSLDAGNDIYDGRGGTVAQNDYIDGGAGNDTFFVDTNKIILYEETGDGTDTVKSTVSFSLDVKYRRAVENLTLLGDGNTNATGNGLNNILKGNSGDNRLSGGAGADTFVFAQNSGHDTVTDFENGTDHIDLKHWTGIDSFADLKAHHLTVSGDDLIVANGGDSLTLHNMHKADLSASDFIF